MIWGSQTFQCLHLRDDFSLFFFFFFLLWGCWKEFPGSWDASPMDSTLRMSPAPDVTWAFQIDFCSFLGTFASKLLPSGLSQHNNNHLMPSMPSKASSIPQLGSFFLKSSRNCNSGYCLSSLLPSKHWEFPAAFYLLHIWRLFSCFFSVLFSLD